MSDNCIFCKIINNEIPSLKIYEDESHLAFLDIRPLNPGHTLVIPKEHTQWIWDLSNKDAGRIFEVCNKIANTQRKVFHTEWIMCEIIGMEINHGHIHLIPRHKNDKHKGEYLNPSLAKKEIPEELEKISLELKKELNN